MKPPIRILIVDDHAMVRFALTEAGSEITTLWGGTLPADIATLWRLAA